MMKKGHFAAAVAVFIVSSAISTNALSDPSWYSSRRASQDPGFVTTPAYIQEDLGQQIITSEMQKPAVTRLCIPLNEIDPLRYQFAFNENAHNIDDIKVLYGHLVRFGLVENPIKQKKQLIYKLSAEAKKLLTDEKCSYAPGELTRPGTLSLVYARYNFAKFVGSNHLPKAMYGNEGGTAVFVRNLSNTANWATDKDFRRGWKLPGLQDLNEKLWCAHYKVTSNGAEIEDTSLCMGQ